MNKDQKHKPKYWVCHKPSEDDVLVNSARKSKSHSQDLAVHFAKCSIGGKPHTTWEDLEEQGWMCSLVELNLVDLNRVV